MFVSQSGFSLNICSIISSVTKNFT
jgi:hypothetical protein